MPVGDKLKKYIQPFSEFVSPVDEPTGADVMMAQRPEAPNEGFWNIMSNLGRMRSGSRLAERKLRMEEEEAASKEALQAAQAEQYMARGELYGAQAENTKVKTDIAKATTSEQIQMAKVQLDQEIAKTESELARAEQLRADALAKNFEPQWRAAQIAIDRYKARVEELKNVWGNLAKQRELEIRQQEANIKQQEATQTGEFQRGQIGVRQREAGVAERRVTTEEQLVPSQIAVNQARVRSLDAEATAKAAFYALKRGGVSVERAKVLLSNADKTAKSDDEFRSAVNQILTNELGAGYTYETPVPKTWIENLGDQIFGDTTPAAVQPTAGGVQPGVAPSVPAAPTGYEAALQAHGSKVGPGMAAIAARSGTPGKIQIVPVDQLRPTDKVLLRK